MRIAIVGPSYPFRGGIAHYTALLCSALSVEHDVRLVSLSRQYPKLLFPGKKQTDESAVKIAVENSAPLIDSMNPLSWIAAARDIRRFAPDLVIIQWWHPFFAPAFGVIAGRCKKFSDVMFICHNVLPHEKGGPTKSLSKFAFSKGDRFVVHSDEDLTNLKSLMPNAAVRKARHPIYEVFNTGSTSQDAARQELGIASEENVILFFGLVRKYKGLKYLIQAMPSVLKSTEATLLIAGEFYDDREEYVQLVKELGIEHKVQLRDEYVPNEKVGVFFSAADLVVLPYVSATQSGIVQIAYAFDKPVVTTDVGGLPEAVKNGVTGFVVPPQDAEALARAVAGFFQTRDTMDFPKNIREFREEFSWDRLVGTIEELAAAGGRK